MKYDILHFNYMDEYIYILRTIKMVDIYMLKIFVKNNVKEDDWMLICRIQ
jgi:hypothetical protein